MEGPLNGVQVAGPATPSIVRTSRPSICGASIRHDRTGSPSSRTVQEPQTPSSHPRCVPVRPRSRTTSASVARTGTVTTRGSPLSVNSTTVSPVGVGTVRTPAAYEVNLYSSYGGTISCLVHERHDRSLTRLTCAMTDRRFRRDRRWRSRRPDHCDRAGAQGHRGSCLRAGAHGHAPWGLAAARAQRPATARRARAAARATPRRIASRRGRVPALAGRDAAAPRRSGQRDGGAFRRTGARFPAPRPQRAARGCVAGGFAASRGARHAARASTRTRSTSCSPTRHAARRRW